MDIQYNMKHNNIHILGLPEEEEEQRIKKLFEKLMTENLPNLIKEKVAEIQNSQTVPIKVDQKKPTLRHIIIKKAKFKDKERIFTAARDKQEVKYKGALIRLAADLSTETLQARGNGKKYAR